MVSHSNTLSDFSVSIDVALLMPHIGAGPDGIFAGTCRAFAQCGKPVAGASGYAGNDDQRRDD